MASRKKVPGGGDAILGRSGCHSQRHSRFVMASVLLLLREEPSYGYQLMDRLVDRGLQDDPADPAAIYRSLRLLEREGMVRSKWLARQAGPARRLYCLTAAGRSLLVAWSKTIRRRRARLERFIDLYGRRPGRLDKASAGSRRTSLPKGRT